MSRRLLDAFASVYGPLALDGLNSVSPPDEFEVGSQKWTATVLNNNKEVYHQTYARLLYRNAIVFPTKQVFDVYLTI